MAKTDTLFTCSHCDAQYTKWTGRCLECGKWGTVAESSKRKTAKKEAAAAAPLATIKKLSDIAASDAKRTATGIGEFDRVLGGGIVPGSFILLGGEPGIGKSTVSLQLATSIPGTLYFSGEESVAQIKLRADRMEVAEKGSLKLSNETYVESIAATIRKEKPILAVVDSVQTILSTDAAGEPGSVGQLRACATRLLEAAKTSGTTILLIGHVTKEGTVAGPRTLEHLVDTVLYLEGDRYHNLRMLRAVKNRFGSTDEIGMFEMDEHGLKEVPNPSELLLAERGEGMSGSVVTCLMEGTRPLLVEVQALVNQTSFGYPVRKASGFDINRLHVLIAVLQKRAKMDLSQYDVHVNIVGGLKAHEPAADLAVCFAIASAFRDKVLGNDIAVFGEVGLGGEIRSVRFLPKRLKECANMQMKRVLTRTGAAKAPSGLSVADVKNIGDLVKKTA